MHRHHNAVASRFSDVPGLKIFIFKIIRVYTALTTLARYTYDASTVVKKKNDDLLYKRGSLFFPTTIRKNIGSANYLFSYAAAMRHGRSSSSRRAASVRRTRATTVPADGTRRGLLLLRAATDSVAHTTPSSNRRPRAIVAPSRCALPSP